MTIAWPLVGHQNAEKEFVEAFKGGCLHHAWMIEGPESIGKSILAHRLAALVLGTHSTDVTNDDPIVKTMCSGAHPDFRYLYRRPDDNGKLKQFIAVDEVRALTSFYDLHSSVGGWRVTIIDSIDELNRFGANALLKTVEEPPNNSLIILIYHGKRSLLPTIRSRCRVLRLKTLSDEEVERSLVDYSQEDREKIVPLARGRPGRGLRLGSEQGLKAAQITKKLFDQMPSIREETISAFVRMSSLDEIAFESAVTEILETLAGFATTNARAADFWIKISTITSDVAEFTMEKGQASACIVGHLLDYQKSL